MRKKCSLEKMAESTNLSLKTLNWSTLLMETSEDSCDSDETFVDEIAGPTKGNSFQHFNQISNQQGGKITNQQLVQEMHKTISSNQITTLQNDEGNLNICYQNKKDDLDKVNGNKETHIIDAHELSYNFSDTTVVNNYIKESDKIKHRFESDFSFTDLTEMSKLQDLDKCLNNPILQSTNACTDYQTLPSGCNTNEPVEFGLDHYLIQENNQVRSKTLDSELNTCLEPHEICNENVLDLATRVSCPYDGEPSTDFQCAIQEDLEDDGFLDILTQNLDHLMNESCLDNLVRSGGYPEMKLCSPPLTLSKGTRRKVLPADKVLPNYRKKNWQSEKKVLPARKCSSAFIDLSNRKDQGDKVTEIFPSSVIEESVIPAPLICTNVTNDEEAQDVKFEQQVRRENCRKQYELEETQSKRNKQVKKLLPKKGKRGRKKKGLYGRMKQETETNNSESVCQEKELMKEGDKTIQEVKPGLEYLEERVARWVSGTDESPPTRELAFKMLGDCQTYTATLQHLKKKNENRRKWTQKCELKLIKLLLIRSQQLEITLDKAIAAADQLMSMELNEISEDSRTTDKEILNEENKYPKPILKNTSSEPSTEEGFNNKRHISFSEDVEYLYLSCSERSSSLGPSQSSNTQQSEHSNTSDREETNCTSRYDNAILKNNDFTNLTSTCSFNQKIEPLKTEKNLEHELLSLRNLTIGSSSSLNKCISEEKLNFECTSMDENNGLTCGTNQLQYAKSEVKKSFLQSGNSVDQLQVELNVNVHPIGEKIESNVNTILKINENSAQSNETFEFSEKNTQPEECWESVSFMSIKSMRIRDPSEFMSWDPSDPPDSWSDLEDWSMCNSTIEKH